LDRAREDAELDRAKDDVVDWELDPEKSEVAEGWDWNLEDSDWNWEESDMYSLFKFERQPKTH